MSTFMLQFVKMNTIHSAEVCKASQNELQDHAEWHVVFIGMNWDANLDMAPNVEHMQALRITIVGHRHVEECILSHDFQHEWLMQIRMLKIHSSQQVRCLTIISSGMLPSEEPEGIRTEPESSAFTNLIPRH